MTDYRPLHHIAPAKGWINDPNGFIHFKGQYHLYCQHNPKDVVWGPMHWLHFQSKDLIHWEEKGIALKPDQPCDLELGDFSGSAIEKDGRMYIIYTSAIDGRQTQSIAVSEDGHHFTKFEGNPVIDEKTLPSGYMIADFRDPKVFLKGGTYYVMCASRHEDGHSSILLFSSLDLFSYQFVGVLKDFHNCEKRGMIECPDILFDGDRCALIYSLQNPKQEGDKFQNRFAVAYQIGKLDLENGRFIPEGEEHELDHGFSCYATQTISENGKHYIVYWEASWGNNHPMAKEGYAGQLSLIKEVRFEGDRLTMHFLPGTDKKHLDVQLVEDVASLKINNIELIFDKPSNKVTLTRKDMDEAIVDDDGNVVEERHFYLSDVQQIKIDYSYDRSCVELSFNDGEVFCSLLNFKKETGPDARIVAEGCVIK